MPVPRNRICKVAFSYSLTATGKEKSDDLSDSYHLTKQECFYGHPYIFEDDKVVVVVSGGGYLCLYKTFRLLLLLHYK